MSDKGELIIAREEINRRIDRIDMRLVALEGMFATWEKRLQNIEARSQPINAVSVTRLVRA